MNYHVWALVMLVARARLWALAACVALCLLAPLSLAAQDKPAPDKHAQYRELIEKALQEYALGHWPEARVFFSDAHAIWPNARTLRGLGMTCYEGRSYVEAIGFLEQALASKTQPLTAKLANEAHGILTQAKRFVSSAYIGTSPEHSELTLDDQPVKLRADGAVLLNPGEHILQVASPGYRTERRTLHAEAGRELHVQVDLRPQEELQPSAASVSLSGPEPPLVTPQPSGPTGDTFAVQDVTAAGALAAVGLAALTTGWVFYALRNDLRVELWELGLIREQGFEQSKFSDYQTRGGVALAAAGAGALAMSLAQYFWLPDDEPVPAWTWAVGGVGAAVAVGALAWAVFGEHCEVTDHFAFCRSTISDPLFAPMLGLQAIPLLSLPIMYAVRERIPMNGANVSLGMSDGSGGMMLTVAGRF
jgi:hypothetical protein